MNSAAASVMTLALIAIDIILVFEAHAAIFDRQEASIGNSDPMCIASQILQNPLGAAKGRLHKDDPLDAPRLLTQGFERRRLRNSGHAAMEVQPTFSK